MRLKRFYNKCFMEKAWVEERTELAEVIDGECVFGEYFENLLTCIEIQISYNFLLWVNIVCWIIYITYVLNEKISY